MDLQLCNGKFIGTVFLSVFTLILLGLPLSCYGQAPSPTYSTTLETALRTSLYTSYEVLQRPDDKLNVTIAYNLLTINGLDIKEQSLSTSGYFSMEWPDSRLKWSSDTTYTNVRFLFSSQTFTWRPAIVVENSVKDIAVISDVNTLMRVNSQGTVSWTPGGIFETSCDVDVTYYPLDTQVCSLKLSTWAYTSNEVNLIMDDPAVDVSYFSQNGEWELINTSSSTTTTSRQSQSFARAEFTFTLRRRPLFHLLNTIFPVILMASLTVFVFHLPPDSGERVGLCLTVLLAYAVYLTLISDNIPQTSLSASLLSAYLALILLISALSVIMTIFVLGLYFRSEDEPVPDWVQSFTRTFLVRVTCWKKRLCCSRKDKIAPNDDVEEIEDFNSKPTDLVTGFNNKPPLSTSHTSFTNVELLHYGKQKEFENVSVTENSEPEETSYTWKEIALMFDKLFFYLFVVMVLLATLVCMGVLVANF